MAAGTVQVGTVAIPVDNANTKEKGKVQISGATVEIDPFEDVGYDKTVEIKIDTTNFKDFFGANTYAATTYKFRTTAFAFASKRPNNATILPFSQREGMLLQSMKKADGR